MESYLLVTYNHIVNFHEIDLQYISNIQISYFITFITRTILHSTAPKMNALPLLL